MQLNENRRNQLLQIICLIGGPLGNHGSKLMMFANEVIPAVQEHLRKLLQEHKFKFWYPFGRRIEYIDDLLEIFKLIKNYVQGTHQLVISGCLTEAELYNCCKVVQCFEKVYVLSPLKNFFVEIKEQNVFS